MRCVDQLVSIATKRGPSLVIGEDEQDVWFGGRMGELKRE